MDPTAVRVNAEGLQKALSGWASTSDRAQALSVSAKAALWMAARKGTREAFNGVDVQSQLLPPPSATAPESDAAARCSHWAFNLYAAMGRSPAAKHRPASSKISKIGAKELREGLGAVKSDIGAIRARAADEDKELDERLEDAEHLMDVASAALAFWNLDKATNLLNAMIKLLRRVRRRWPSYSTQIDSIIARLKAMLGLLSDLEIEELVRAAILSGKEPDKKHRKHVKRLQFATERDGEWLPDALHDLSLVSLCVNLEQLSFAGCPASDAAPLLACKRLAFIDAESSALATVEPLLAASGLLHLEEIIWGGTPAFNSSVPNPKNVRLSAGEHDGRRIRKLNQSAGSAAQKG